MMNPHRYAVRLSLGSLESRQLPTALAAPGTNPYWISRFQQLAEQPKADSNVVMLGDSILDNLRPESAAWESHFSLLGVSNYAIGTSTVANVRWVVQSGLLDGITPQVVVLHAGTNDLAFNATSSQAVVAEIEACIDAIHARMPETLVLLVGLLPRGEYATDPFRPAITQINSRLAELSATKAGVAYADVGDGFLHSDDRISIDVMWDFVHPTTAGYDVLARALADHLRCTLSVPAIRYATNESAPTDDGYFIAPPHVGSLVWSWLITADDEWWDT
jgi:beta-glucosidase